MTGINHRIPIEIRILAGIAVKLSKHSLESRLTACGAGIGGLHYGILQLLRQQGHTQSELSRKLMLDPSTLVPVVDTLQNKGLLKRGIDPADRRRTPLSITDSGIELLEQVSQVDESDPLVHSLNEMGEANAQQFLDLLREIVRHMPDGEGILAEIDANLQEVLGGANSNVSG